MCAYCGTIIGCIRESGLASLIAKHSIKLQERLDEIEERIKNI